MLDTYYVPRYPKQGTSFDFAEGESELVSGFNDVYGGGRFALIF
jgi:NADH:ubiquinone oxidoreductase subunit H